MKHKDTFILHTSNNTFKYIKKLNISYNNFGLHITNIKVVSVTLKRVLHALNRHNK